MIGTDSVAAVTGAPITAWESAVPDRTSTEGRPSDDAAAARPTGRRVRDLINGPAILFVAMTVNNVAIFGFHVLVSRVLGPGRYGALGALLALTLLLTVASASVTMAVIRQVAGHPSDIRWDIGRQMTLVGAVVAGLAVVAVAGSTGISHYLHLHSVAPVLLLVVYGVGALVGIVPRGVLLGQRRYKLVSMAVVVGAAVRLGLGALLAGPFGVSGSLIAYAAAETVTGVVLLIACTRPTLAGQVGAKLRVPVRALVLAVGASTGLWLLAGTDQFLARHLLTSVDAGIYVAASTAASIALWLPYNVTSAAFPGLASDAHHGDPGRRPFALGLAAAAVIAAGAALAMTVFPHVVVSIAFGRSYTDSARVLMILATANAAQGVTGFLVYHQVAHGRGSSLLPWAGFIALVAAISLHHQSPQAVAYAALTISLGLLVVMFVRSAQLARRDHADSRTALA